MRQRSFWLSLGALVAAWSSLITAQGSPSRLYDAIRTNDLARLQTMVRSASDATPKTTVADPADVRRSGGLHQAIETPVKAG
jgi:hypothetical protein